MQKSFTITVHVLVKNEQTYLSYALRSVIDYVDKVLIFDTGSSDGTREICREFVNKYPDKVELHEKEPCDWEKHTQYRQEMLEMTKTDWAMILDGDEVWTKKGMEEAIRIIEEGKDNLDCASADCYLCTGDIFHDHDRKLMEKFTGIHGLYLTRFYKIYPGEMHWIYRPDIGAHADFVRNGKLICENKEHHLYLKNKFWHTTHLRRSSADDDDFTSNSPQETRRTKRRETYFVIGQRIKENVPEVFDEKFKKSNRLSFWRSFFNFWPYFLRRMLKKIF